MNLFSEIIADHLHRHSDTLHAGLVERLNGLGVPAKSVVLAGVHWAEWAFEMHVYTHSGHVFTFRFSDVYPVSLNHFKDHLTRELDRLAVAYKAKHYPKTPLPFAEEPDSIPVEKFLDKPFDNPFNPYNL